jgi:hypothetical protein
MPRPAQLHTNSKRPNHSLIARGGHVVSLKDRLAVAPNVKPKFEQLIDALPQDERAALIAAAKDPAWSTAELIRVLKDEGISVSKDTLGPWRKRLS